MAAFTIEPIGYIHTAFPEKFGLPRQSGVVPSLKGEVRFESKYRNPDALRGLERYTHIWLIWVFSANVEIMKEEGWHPMTRPPRLGGNEKLGVFATRSPFRPNNLGMSVVRLEKVGQDEEGPYLLVSGIDMMDGTPIVDIKPYVPFSDSVPEAAEGISGEPWKKGRPVGTESDLLDVEIPDGILEKIPEEERESVRGILGMDPRPAYQDDPERVYGLAYSGMNIRFCVRDGKAVVVSVEPLKGNLPDDPMEKER